MRKMTGIFRALIFITLLGPAALGTPIVEPRQASSCENSATTRNCWAEYDIDTDYYVSWPHTGVTREYWLVAEKAFVAPDGYEVERLVFNGTVPGPTIEADWGDEIIVHVTNNIPDNGTTIHWHGIRMINTTTQDGVPGITQCPIAPGQTQTYRFNATQYGSSWYHSHFSLQAGLGLFGPLVIHGPTTANYDVDIGPVVLQDWYHSNPWEIWATTQRVIALEQPVAENGLINGLNPYDCSASTDSVCLGNASRFEIEFEPGKKYLLRVVGAQTDGYMKLTIDGHQLQVVAMDFVPIVPYMTDNIILSSGQRYDVIVEATESSGSFWMRALYQTACNQNSNENADNILGIVRYAGADNTTAEPTTTVSSSITNSCGDEPYESLVPWVAHTVADDVDIDYVNMGWYYDLPSLVFHWTLRGSTLAVEWDSPTLLDIHNDTAYAQLDNVFVTDAPADSFVYLIIQDLTLVDAFHPIHIHGHDMYVLAQGEGLFVPYLVTLNTDNPPRRDTATLYGNGYTVIGVKIDNPGAWLLHCHIAWHASQGLAMTLVERESEIPSLMSGDVPALEDTCASWLEYSITEKVEMDDSGI